MIGRKPIAVSGTKLALVGVWFGASALQSRLAALLSWRQLAALNARRCP